MKKIIIVATGMAIIIAIITMSKRSQVVSLPEGNTQLVTISNNNQTLRFEGMSLKPEFAK